MTPTQRSLKHLRDAGYLAAVTEHWNHFAKIRQDLFGFVDILAVNGLGTLAVQCTSASNVSSRVKKIHSNPATTILLHSGWRIEVHGWKKGKRGEPSVVCIEEDTSQVILDT